MLAGYLTGGEGLDAPEQLRDVLDGHLQAAAARSERQHLGLLQQTTPSGPLGCNHGLQEAPEGRMRQEEEKTTTGSRRAVANPADAAEPKPNI